MDCSKRGREGVRVSKWDRVGESGRSSTYTTPFVKHINAKRCTGAQRTCTI